MESSRSRIRLHDSENMSINQDKRKTRTHVSNPELTAVWSDPERIVRNRTSPSLLKTFRQADFRNKAVQEREGSLAASLQSDTQGSRFKRTIGCDIAPAVNPFISDPLIALELRNAMRKMTQAKAKRIFVEQKRSIYAKGSKRNTVRHFL